jgi:hypothetical protein
MLVPSPDTHNFGVKGMRMLNNIGSFVRPSGGLMETLDANKLVEFQTTLRVDALKWYMKSIEPGNPQGQPFHSCSSQTKWFIVEFCLPQSEQHPL